MEYELSTQYPKAKGAPSLKKRTRIKPITVGGMDFIGHDRTNLFWTSDFIQSHPEIFKPVNQ